MTTLDPKAGYVILINTFTVEPSKAEELVSALSRATEDGMRQRPGFVLANLHVSLDKRHVTNYAQWRSQEDLETMMKDPAARAHAGNRTLGSFVRSNLLRAARIPRG